MTPKPRSGMKGLSFEGQFFVVHVLGLRPLGFEARLKLDSFAGRWGSGLKALCVLEMTGFPSLRSGVLKVEGRTCELRTKVRLAGTYRGVYRVLGRTS